MMQIYQIVTPQQCLHQIQVLFIEFFHFSVIVSFPLLSSFFDWSLCNNSMVVLYSSLVYQYCWIKKCQANEVRKDPEDSKCFNLKFTCLSDKKIYNKQTSSHNVFLFTTDI